MHKKAIIFDLDNTIYPVSSIAATLFESVFELMNKFGVNDEAAKDAIMRKPWHVVAAIHQFSGELTKAGTELLKKLTFSGEIHPFEDYIWVKEIRAKRFLVTMGFPNLQWSKIRGMGIENDFDEIHIIDPSISARTKKDAFTEIMVRHGYEPDELLVVGDDPESELRAARELGIDSVLYHKDRKHDRSISTYTVSGFNQLLNIMPNF